MRKFLYGIVSVMVCALLLSCNKSKAPVDSEALVTVEGQSLYPSDLSAIIPEGTSAEDSALLADNYIQKWAIDVLLYANAKRNITNQAEIDQMVEEYRKSLIVNSYQQKIMQERLQAPTEDEIASFYEEHRNEFKLNDYIVKGVLVKIPNKTPKQDALRKQMRKFDMASIEYIEKYSVQYAVNYDYFLDKYVYFNDILKIIPIETNDVNAFLSQTKFYETQDSSYTYMLRLTEVVPADEPAPLEMVHDKASAMLFNVRKIGYIRQFSKSLYDDAKRSGKITFKTTKP